MLCKNKSALQFDFFFYKRTTNDVFVSKFHGTGSISLGDILFLSVRYQDEMGDLFDFGVCTFQF